MGNPFSPEDLTSFEVNHAFKTSGTNHDVTIAVHDNTHLVGAEHDSAPVVLFAGYGERGNTVKQALLFLALNNVPAIAPVIDYTNLPKNVDGTVQSLVERFIKEVPLGTLQGINQYTGRAQHRVIGNSLGGAMVGGALSQSHDHISDFALINPLGMTATTEGQVSASALKFFGKFIWGTALHTEPQRGFFTASSGVGREVAADVKHGAFITKLGVMNTLNFTPAIVAHTADNSGTILSGGRDRLFPTAAIRESIGYANHSYQHVPDRVYDISSILQRNGLRVLEVQGAHHENLALPRGQRMLHFASQALGY
jgi:hypothetical protein